MAAADARRHHGYPNLRLGGGSNATGARLCESERRMAIRCLIVDDSRSFLLAARTLFERQGVAVVGLASSGEEAMRKTDLLHPDVVLVDIGLGEESGFDVAQQLPAPVILVSTRSENDLRELLAASPAVGFVSKADLSAEAIRVVLER
jgi:DNA-binding NarL/FixJ family response regulator